MALVDVPDRRPCRLCRSDWCALLGRLPKFETSASRIWRVESFCGRFGSIVSISLPKGLILQKEPLVTKHATGTFEVKMNPQVPEANVGDPSIARLMINIVDGKHSYDFEYSLEDSH